MIRKYLPRISSIQVNLLYKKFDDSNSGVITKKQFLEVISDYVSMPTLKSLKGDGDIHSMGSIGMD